MEPTAVDGHRPNGSHDTFAIVPCDRRDSSLLCTINGVGHVRANACIPHLCACLLGCSGKSSVQLCVHCVLCVQLPLCCAYMRLCVAMRERLAVRLSCRYLDWDGTIASLLQIKLLHREPSATSEEPPRAGPKRLPRRGTRLN